MLDCLIMWTIAAAEEFARTYSNLSLCLILTFWSYIFVAVIGTAFAFNLLFHIPVWVGVLITGSSTLLLLGLQRYGVFNCRPVIYLKKTCIKCVIIYNNWVASCLIHFCFLLLELEYDAWMGTRCGSWSSWSRCWCSSWRRASSGSWASWSRRRWRWSRGSSSPGSRATAPPQTPSPSLELLSCRKQSSIIF